LADADSCGSMDEINAPSTKVVFHSNFLPKILVGTTIDSTPSTFANGS
jgi:hypothetical protein